MIKKSFSKINVSTWIITKLGNRFYQAMINVVIKCMNYNKIPLKHIPLDIIVFCSIHTQQEYFKMRKTSMSDG